MRPSRGIAHAGGADGLDIVRRILAEAGEHLSADGTLLVEIGTRPGSAGSRSFRTCRSCGWTPPRARARCSRSPASALRQWRRRRELFLNSAPTLLSLAAEKSETMADTTLPERRATPPHRGAVPAEEVRLANRNYGILLETLRHDVTPAGLHYLLNHFDVPYVPDGRLAGGGAGCVARPATVSLDEIKAPAGPNACRHAGVRRQRPRRHEPALPEHALDQRGGGNGAMDRNPAAARARPRRLARRRRRHRLHRRRPRLRPRRTSTPSAAA